MSIKLPNNKIARTLAEQVGFLSRQVEHLQEVVDSMSDEQLEDSIIHVNYSDIPTSLDSAPEAVLEKVFEKGSVIIIADISEDESALYFKSEQGAADEAYFYQLTPHFNDETVGGLSAKTFAQERIRFANSQWIREDLESSSFFDTTETLSKFLKGDDCYMTHDDAEPLSDFIIFSTGALKIKGNLCKTTGSPAPQMLSLKNASDFSLTTTFETTFYEGDINSLTGEQKVNLSTLLEHAVARGYVVHNGCYLPLTFMSIQLVGTLQLPVPSLVIFGNTTTDGGKTITISYDFANSSYGYALEEV